MVFIKTNLRDQVWELVFCNSCWKMRWHVIQSLRGLIYVWLASREMGVIMTALSATWDIHAVWYSSHLPLQWTALDPLVTFHNAHNKRGICHWGPLLQTLPPMVNASCYKYFHWLCAPFPHGDSIAFLPLWSISEDAWRKDTTSLGECYL